MLKKVNIDYDLITLLAADYTIHTDSYIDQNPKPGRETYRQQMVRVTRLSRPGPLVKLQQFNDVDDGFPKTYGAENTRYHSVAWRKDQIDYIELGKQLNMDVIYVTTMKQSPGNVMTCHRDPFDLLFDQFPNRTEPKVRAYIFLEDYKLGHIVQYVLNDKVETSLHWKAGDGLIWDSDVPHLTANVGLQDKYTMQVTGFCLT